MIMDYQIRIPFSYLVIHITFNQYGYSKKILFINKLASRYDNDTLIA
ncbi:MAG: hypothetical protein K0S47_3419 [Herbinix sp.]|jgi:hypothetical protein|nr:hypothetical protein [Herbinix sp.]